MKSPRLQPLELKERPQERDRSITTTEAATSAWDPHWGLFTVLTVGVFVFLLRMPITSHMAGIAIDERRIAVNVAKLPELIRQSGALSKDSAFEASSADVVRVAAGMCCFVCRTHHFRCQWSGIAQKL
jgi:hypothetical protein